MSAADRAYSDALVQQYVRARLELDRRTVETANYAYLTDNESMVHTWHSMSCICPSCRATDYAACHCYENVDYKGLSS